MESDKPTDTRAKVRDNHLYSTAKLNGTQSMFCLLRRMAMSIVVLTWWRGEGKNNKLIQLRKWNKVLFDVLEPRSTSVLLATAHCWSWLSCCCLSASCCCGLSCGALILLDVWREYMRHVDAYITCCVRVSVFRCANLTNSASMSAANKRARVLNNLVAP